MTIAVSFAVCYAYQGIYLLVSLLKKMKRLPEEMPHRFTVLIAARNEEAVIGALIRSIRRQNYPARLHQNAGTGAAAESQKQKRIGFKALGKAFFRGETVPFLTLRRISPMGFRLR